MRKSNKDGDRKFRLSYHMETVLTVDELWPDGDAPENPTEKDVSDLVVYWGGPLDVIPDWNLDPRPRDLTMEIKLVS